MYFKVTKDKEKLEELKETNSEKAQKMADKAAWRKAMEMSKGVKVCYLLAPLVLPPAVFL